MSREHEENGPGVLEEKLDLLLLQIVEDDVGRFGLNTPILDDDAGASDNFASLAFFINFAETSPFAELLIVVYLHQGDVVLLAQGSDKLLVHGLTAVVG